MNIRMIRRRFSLGARRNTHVPTTSPAAATTTDDINHRTSTTKDTDLEVFVASRRNSSKARAAPLNERRGGGAAFGLQVIGAAQRRRRRRGHDVDDDADDSSAKSSSLPPMEYVFRVLVWRGGGGPPPAAVATDDGRRERLVSYDECCALFGDLGVDVVDAQMNSAFPIVDLPLDDDDDGADDKNPLAEHVEAMGVFLQDLLSLSLTLESNHALLRFMGFTASGKWITADDDDNVDEMFAPRDDGDDIDEPSSSTTTTTRDDSSREKMNNDDGDTATSPPSIISVKNTSPAAAAAAAAASRHQGVTSAEPGLQTRQRIAYSFAAPVHRPPPSDDRPAGDEEDGATTTRISALRDDWEHGRISSCGSSFGDDPTSPRTSRSTVYDASRSVPLDLIQLQKEHLTKRVNELDGRLHGMKLTQGLVLALHSHALLRVTREARLRAFEKWRYRTILASANSAAKRTSQVAQDEAKRQAAGRIASTWRLVAIILPLERAWRTWRVETAAQTAREALESERAAHELELSAEHTRGAAAADASRHLAWHRASVRLDTFFRQRHARRRKAAFAHWRVTALQMAKCELAAASRDRARGYAIKLDQMRRERGATLVAGVLRRLLAGRLSLAFGLLKLSTGLTAQRAAMLRDKDDVVASARREGESRIRSMQEEQREIERALQFQKAREEELRETLDRARIERRLSHTRAAKLREESLREAHIASIEHDKNTARVSQISLALQIARAFVVRAQKGAVQRALSHWRLTTHEFRLAGNVAPDAFRAMLDSHNKMASLTAQHKRALRSLPPAQRHAGDTLGVVEQMDAPSAVATKIASPTALVAAAVRADGRDGGGGSGAEPTTTTASSDRRRTPSLSMSTSEVAAVMQGQQRHLQRRVHLARATSILQCALKVAMAAIFHRWKQQTDTASYFLARERLREAERPALEVAVETLRAQVDERQSQLAKVQREHSAECERRRRQHCHLMCRLNLARRAAFVRTLISVTSRAANRRRRACWQRWRFIVAVARRNSRRDRAPPASADMRQNGGFLAKALLVATAPQSTATMLDSGVSSWRPNVRHGSDEFEMDTTPTKNDGLQASDSSAVVNGGGAFARRRSNDETNSVGSSRHGGARVRRYSDADGTPTGPTTAVPLSLQHQQAIVDTAFHLDESMLLAAGGVSGQDLVTAVASLLQYHTDLHRRDGRLRNVTPDLLRLRRMLLGRIVDKYGSVCAFGGSSWQRVVSRRFFHWNAAVQVNSAVQAERAHAARSEKRAAYEQGRERQRHARLRTAPCSPPPDDRASSLRAASSSSPSTALCVALRRMVNARLFRAFHRMREVGILHLSRRTNGARATAMCLRKIALRRHSSALLRWRAFVSHDRMQEQLAIERGELKDKEQEVHRMAGDARAELLAERMKMEELRSQNAHRNFYCAAVMSECNNGLQMDSAATIAQQQQMKEAAECDDDMYTHHTQYTTNGTPGEYTDDDDDDDDDDDSGEWFVFRRGAAAFRPPFCATSSSSGGIFGTPPTLPDTAWSHRNDLYTAADDEENNASKVNDFAAAQDDIEIAVPDPAAARSWPRKAFCAGPFRRGTYFGPPPAVAPAIARRTTTVPGDTASQTLPLPKYQRRHPQNRQAGGGNNAATDVVALSEQPLTWLAHSMYTGTKLLQNELQHGSCGSGARLRAALADSCSILRTRQHPGDPATTSADDDAEWSQRLHGLGESVQSLHRGSNVVVQEERRRSRAEFMCAFDQLESFQSGKGRGHIASDGVQIAAPPTPRAALPPGAALPRVALRSLKSCISKIGQAQLAEFEELVVAQGMVDKLQTMIAGVLIDRRNSIDAVRTANAVVEKVGGSAPDSTVGQALAKLRASLATADGGDSVAI